MCQARADRITPRVLYKMRKSGCNLILYGVESGSQESLDKIGKKETIETIKKTFKMTHKAGIETIGTFILGLPWDTEKSIQQTIELAKTIDPTYAQFTIFTPLPGSQGWNDYRQQMIGKDIEWQKFTWYSTYNDLYSPNDSLNLDKNAQDLDAMMIRGYLEFLLRRRQLKRFVLNPVYRRLGLVGIKKIAHHFLRKHGIISR